jgi:hypothetical protein
MESTKVEKPSLAEDQQNALTAPGKRWLWFLAFLLILGGVFTIWRFFSPSDRFPAQASVQTPPRPVETIPIAFKLPSQFIVQVVQLCWWEFCIGMMNNEIGNNRHHHGG